MAEERNDIRDPPGGAALGSCESRARNVEILQVSYFYDSVARTRLYEVSVQRSAAPRWTSCGDGFSRGSAEFLCVTRRMCTRVSRVGLDVFAGWSEYELGADGNCRGRRGCSACTGQDVVFSVSETGEGNLRAVGKCMFK